jgi:hypothetical protein
MTLHISSFDYEMRKTGKSSSFTHNCSCIVHVQIFITGLFIIVFKQKSLKENKNNFTFVSLSICLPAWKN